MCNTKRSQECSSLLTYFITLKKTKQMVNSHHAGQIKIYSSNFQNIKNVLAIDKYVMVHVVALFFKSMYL